MEAQRLVDLEEEKLCNTTETLLVEPHYFTLSCSNLTPELVAQGCEHFISNAFLLAWKINAQRLKE